MPDLSSVRFRPSEQVVAQPVGQETVILHVPSERFVTLDDTGAAMWRIGSASASVAQAIDTLIDEYDVDRSTLEADFMAFAERLHSLELANLEPIV
jgi:hypothetical protein